jgi:hypothetical protein
MTSNAISPFFACRGPYIYIYTRSSPLLRIVAENINYGNGLDLWYKYTTMKVCILILNIMSFFSLLNLFITIKCVCSQNCQSRPLRRYTKTCWADNFPVPNNRVGLSRDVLTGTCSISYWAYVIRYWDYVRVLCNYCVSITVYALKNVCVITLYCIFACQGLHGPVYAMCV